MRKTFILILLGLGTLAGYGHAFHSYRHHHCADGPGGFRGAWMGDDARGWRSGEECPNAPRPPQPPPMAPSAP